MGIECCGLPGPTFTVAKCCGVIIVRVRMQVSGQCKKELADTVCPSVKEEKKNLSILFCLRNEKRKKKSTSMKSCAHSFHSKVSNFIVSFYLYLPSLPPPSLPPSPLLSFSFLRERKTQW